MKPNGSSSDALSSLYEAIGCSQDGKICCFAQAQGDKLCISTLPEIRRKKINPLLQTLALYELGSKDPNAAQTVERALAELTRSLVCNRPIIPHAVKFELGGKRYKDSMEYVYFMLTSNFKSWQLERKVEEQRNYRQHTPNRASRRSLATSKGYASSSKNVRCSDEDTYDSSYEDSEETDDDDSEEAGDDSEEASDGDVCDTMKRQKLQRPKLVRESPQGERDLLVTPVRSRRTRNRYMAHNGTKAPEESSEPSSSLSPGDDEFIVSPASVTSPDPSELFTPLSTVSTPDSLASTVGFESRRSSFRTSYRKRQDASPTRGAELTDLDILSRDMRLKLNLSRSISGKEGDFDDERSPDTQSQNAESEKEVATRSTPLQLIRFVPRKQPVRKILESMAKSPGERGFGPGWVYGFTDPRQLGHIKIGYTEYPVETRMEEWKRCGWEPFVEFDVAMPCAPKKMERLIHLTLHMEEQEASCPAASCTKKHKEWFKISTGEAKEVVEIWKKFSELTPYAESRKLDDIWQSIVTAQQAKPWPSGTKTWLKKELLTIVSKETKLRDLQKILERKKQKRKEIEQQLLEAEEDEKCLREQMEGLAISNRK
ncbi:hypothetical protein FLAG1_00713 [Fusarium langsethiae]|uniref:Bacteriophage T5 Orf172 DNA-binding domain-containing protein n=1 Tax=Fusarium langsethiae TaxID=179993 RepID=A0A0M9F5H5_FUSLA|nr:hypothetical protein FLAG1_00713 [Fusarium langsethiae]GKT98868.1 unnamed protein product [Fusarium langsethiae]GKU14466.1 unnamed protein product [Fusarium langsethiae]